MHATSSGRRVAKLGKMRAEGGAGDKDWKLEEAVGAHERVDEGRVRQEARQVFRAQAQMDFGCGTPRGLSLVSELGFERASRSCWSSVWGARAPPALVL